MKIKTILPLLLVLVASIWSAIPALADGIALAQTVQAGQTAEFTFELRNDTAVEHRYDLSLSGFPENLAVSFTLNGPPVGSVSIPAQDYAQITLRVETPADTAVGRYSGQVSAVRDDGERVEVPLSLTVENIYALRIVSQSLNLTTFSGQEFTFDVNALNSGAAPVANTTVLVDAPPKWVIQVEPASLPNLDPGAEALFHVRVLVPASQSAQDQNLTLALSSDQVTSPESQLTVRVQKSPTFFYAAGGLMVLAVAGVLVYFRSKGRR